jgi:invasion protein IalB
MNQAVGKFLAVLMAFAVTGCACGKARAATGEPDFLGSFGDWAAYAYKAADSQVCYISSKPTGQEPAKAKRDPAFLIVTHMPGRKVRGEISTIIGYAFKQDSTVELKVGEEAFTLFTNGDGAWADKPETEQKIVAAMKSGKNLTVTGTSWRGTVTTDTYSLNGVTAALAKIDETCK